MDNSVINKDVRNSIHELKKIMLEMPQWDAEKNTSHYFAEGLYCRVLFRPAGTLIIGKKHKKSHFYMVMSGRVSITNGEGKALEVEGPYVIVSNPGTERAVLALTDATCITVHRTDKTDLDEIEKELIEEDQTALFDSSNRLKVKEVTCPG